MPKKTASADRGKPSHASADGLILRSAAVRPGTFDPDQRTVELTWSTGGDVERYDWWADEEYIERLSMDPTHIRMGRLNNGAPFLNCHHSYSTRDVIGVVESASVVDGVGIAKVRFSRRDDVQEILQDIQDGILRNVSVGYMVHRMENSTDEITGKMIRLAVDWEPHEISIVPIGADDGAKIRSHSGVLKMGKKLKQRLLQLQGEIDAITARGGAVPEELFARLQKLRSDAELAMRADGEEGDKTDGEDEDMASSVAKAVQGLVEKALAGTRAENGNYSIAGTVTLTPSDSGDGEPADDSAADGENSRGMTVADERKRVAAIMSTVRSAGLEPEYADRLVAKGVSLDNARAMILDRLAKRSEEMGPTGTRIAAVPGGDARDKRMLGCQNWLIQRAGRKAMMQQAGHQVGDPGEFRGYSLIDIARDYLEAAGVKTRGMSKLEVAGAALGMTRGMTAYNTTSDFTVLLENTLNKLLLAAYGITPDTWSTFCYVGTVTDFRAHNRYQMGTFGSLDSLNEHGEFKQKTIPDGEKQTITASTKGNIIGITRQAIVNDDMDAFSRLPMMLGRGAKLTIETAVYTSLALNSGLGPNLSDGNPVFHARTYTNIDTSAAAPSVSSFDSARQIIGAHRDVSGNEVLDLRPAIWLGPLSKGGAARVVNNSEYDPDTANKLQRFNIGRNMLQTIVDTARLSGTRWYMFADPNIAPVMEVAFLDGQREPQLEMEEGFRFDGVQWRARLDFGVAGVGYNGCCTNAGA